jgi:hypothetical protein
VKPPRNPSTQTGYPDCANRVFIEEAAVSCKQKCGRYKKVIECLHSLSSVKRKPVPRMLSHFGDISIFYHTFFSGPALLVPEEIIIYLLYFQALCSPHPDIMPDHQRGQLGSVKQHHLKRMLFREFQCGLCK